MLIIRSEVSISIIILGALIIPKADLHHWSPHHPLSHAPVPNHLLLLLRLLLPLLLLTSHRIVTTKRPVSPYELRRFNPILRRIRLLEIFVRALAVIDAARVIVDFALVRIVGTCGEDGVEVVAVVRVGEVAAVEGVGGRGGCGGVIKVSWGLQVAGEHGQGEQGKEEVGVHCCCCLVFGEAGWKGGVYTCCCYTGNSVLRSRIRVVRYTPTSVAAGRDHRLMLAQASSP
ncbi:hypothetical protein FN846DRAFT_568082 [Sphaerosporella brunnea]|uniref:Uncharacterized protein n=1 Tax=Sphaerosporella brunnea TaxID=1250544 RepID=A0A5J5F2G3_9PEZI|nr:hypothetical protein FN846DRAFT_568082 [Sphaerosporella brunnea]